MAPGDWLAPAARGQCHPPQPWPGIDGQRFKRAAEKHCGMYVNERTLDYGPDGREAVRRLLDMGYQAGIITQPARVDFV